MSANEGLKRLKELPAVLFTLKHNLPTAIADYVNSLF